MSAEQDNRGQNASRQMAELVARAWADVQFKQRLLAEPANVLREHGIEVAAGTEIRIVEPPENVLYLVLPPRPPAFELTSGQLAGVAGGDISEYYNPYSPPPSTSSSCFFCAMF